MPTENSFSGTSYFYTLASSSAAAMLAADSSTDSVTELIDLERDAEDDHVVGGWMIRRRPFRRRHSIKIRSRSPRKSRPKPNGRPRWTR